MRTLGTTVQTGVITQQFGIGSPNGDNIGDLGHFLHFRTTSLAMNGDSFDAGLIIQPVDKTLQGNNGDDLRDVAGDQYFSGKEREAEFRICENFLVF